MELIMLKLEQKLKYFVTKISSNLSDKHILFCICDLWFYFDGLVQDCSNSIADALELLQSCAKPYPYL